MKTTLGAQGLRIQGKGWQVRILLSQWSRSASAGTTLQQWLTLPNKM
ncbi:hypothetical protein [Paenibacillus brevis]|uniref:Z-ring formation inhibitor MciZ n=1 Tax=Paenibacillus brevis TaxID=2841508 RepID=A0ABS6FQU8_9BACL|nr:hypothetical protein [Paenibacillus brevis]MBU5672605.1 hypothetical protein [Paenibacillus brevis]